MKELILTISDLRHLDQSVDVIMKFLAQPNQHFDVVNNSLHQAIAQLNSDKSLHELYNQYNKLMTILNDKWWDHCYPLHESHFHKSFKDYCNCPFTCITEIADCIEKCIGGKA